MTPPPPATCDAPALRELVVLIHGYACHPVVLSLLERRIQRGGYATHNWGYWSIVGSLGRHARRLRGDLERLAETTDRLHVVAHSMGSIVARLAVSHAALPRLGRMVLIAPPNRGSPVSRFFAPLLRPICPAVAELSSRPTSLVHQIGTPAGLEVGIISAGFDLLVPRASTVLDGQADYICLTGTHTSLVFQQNAARQIRTFLATGRFDHPPASGDRC